MLLGVFLPHLVRELAIWRGSCVFHTYIKHNDKSYEVMIDGSTYVNIAKTAIERMNLRG